MLQAARVLGLWVGRCFVNGAWVVVVLYWWGGCSRSLLLYPGAVVSRKLLIKREGRGFSVGGVMLAGHFGCRGVVFDVCSDSDDC